jgi:hypothetical protein
MYPAASLENNKDFKRLKEVITDEKQAYEAYLNQRALINAFNRKGLMDLNGQSYTDMILNTIEDYPTLASKYSILSQFTKPNIATGEEVLSLNDVAALKDAEIAEIYHQNLKDLADETVKKVSDPKDNERLSKLFKMLPLVAIYQHGIGYSKYGFNKALPYEGFIGVMKSASEIFMENQLNEETLNTVFNKLTDSKNKYFKDYVVSPKAYASPEPVAVVEEDTISEEEAGALLERMGVQSVEEAETVESVFVEELSNEEQIENYRAQEQAEVLAAIPNIADYPGTYGKEQGTMPDSLYAIYRPIYDKYDALISPLLNAESPTDTPITGKITDVNAPEGLPGIPRSSTDCQ